MSTPLERLLPRGMEVQLDPHHKAVLTINKKHNINVIGFDRAVRNFIGNLGLDIKDVNLKDTPRRVTKLWTEWLKPQTLELKTFPGKSGMVILKNHRFISVCPHHLLPFEMIGSVAYVPQDHVLGISKLPRMLNFAGVGMMLQESITEFCADLLDTLLQPRGVAVSVTGIHGCMRLRGVESGGSITTTAVRGVFLTDEKARSEFLHTSGKMFDDKA